MDEAPPFLALQDDLGMPGEVPDPASAQDLKPLICDWLLALKSAMLTCGRGQGQRYSEKPVAPEAT